LLILEKYWFKIELSKVNKKIFVTLDLIILNLQNHGGISVYWYELIKRMSEDPDYIIKTFIYNKKSNFYYKQIIDLISFNKKNEIVNKNYLNSLLFRFFPRLSIKYKKVLFHSSYLSTFLSFNKYNILTIHDLGHERGITQSGIKKHIHVFFKRIALIRAKGIICVSDFTKNELLYFYPFCHKKNIKVIHNGVDDAFYPFLNEEPLIKGKYILYIGTRFKYKNFIKSINCISLLENYQLVIIGGGKLNNAEIKYLDKKLKNRFFHFQNVSSIELNNYYNFAFCLLYLSEYEGFGIPLVEAMKSGCPFITFDNASIPEISNKAGILLEPNVEILDIVSSIISLEDEKFRKLIVNKGFDSAQKYSWDTCYIETKNFHNNILNN
jgi:glycosyltransferase involved in cell wall biosynthesis